MEKIISVALGGLLASIILYYILFPIFPPQPPPIPQQSVSKQLQQPPMPISKPPWGGRWPWTSERLVEKGDLSPLSLADLDLMRNEIYARHSWVFNRRGLQDYFGRQPWYQPKSDPSNLEQSNRWAQAELTGIEKKTYIPSSSWKKP